ncbi:hypothetical protein L7F22_026128 [Adiantum nelumboides]|nr:hypothetical protein [Adiantum nelumboides]
MPRTLLKVRVGRLPQDSMECSVTRALEATSSTSQRIYAYRYPKYLSHNYHKNKSSTTTMEMLFARLCGWCRNDKEKAMQEDIYALEEYLKHIQKEREYLATQNSKLQAALQKAEDTKKRSDQKTASLREKLGHEIKMLQAKGDELLEQSDGDAYIIPSLFENLRSDYKRLQEEDLKTLLQARLGDKSMKLS